MKRFSALSTLQLRYLLRKMLATNNTFVCAIDQLKLIDKSSFAVVFNNQKSNQPGMHWCALYKDKYSSTIELFDSFALPLSFFGPAIRTFVKKQNARLVKNTFQIQHIDSMMCGYIAIYFLVKRSKGITFEKILSKFSKEHLRRNEKIVKKMFSRVKFPLFHECKMKCIKKCKMAKYDISKVCIQKNGKCNKI